MRRPEPARDRGSPDPSLRGPCLAISTERHDPASPGTTRAVAVRLRGVSKTFGGETAGSRGAKRRDGAVVTAVDAIDLDIYDGEFFSMLGPSGSGKTTTLRMIAGFELPTAGTILLHGEDVTNVPPFDRDVNTVFQDYALFPHMTVGDNVAYGLMVRKVAKAERDRPGHRGPADGPPRGVRGPQARASCPAASASASPSRGRSSTGRGCCCSTSRSARSTSSSARRCRSSSRPSSSRSASPSST